MATKYYAVLTNVGAAKLANATALGAQVEITQMAVGDGNGVLPTPNPAQTALVHELRRKPLNSLSIDPNNANQIIAEQVIPEDEGGWWIREIGLFDKDGDMIAVANCAETYKPQLQEGSGRVQVVRMILIVSSTAAVTLKIDPSVVLATRQYVDDQIIQVKSYVDQKMAAHVAAADPHKQYAPKESPALTGRPTAPTAEGKDSSTQIANTAFVQAAIAALVGSSPEALDTLNELAAALGNDPNFATTVTNSLAGKMDKSANGSDIENVSVFLQNLGALATSGGTITGNFHVDGETSSGGNISTSASVLAAYRLAVGADVLDPAAYIDDQGNLHSYKWHNQNLFDDVSRRIIGESALQAGFSGADISKPYLMHSNGQSVFLVTSTLAGIGIPMIGMPFYWPIDKMPNLIFPELSGMSFAKMNGASFNASLFPNLAKVFPSLVLPDTRGEFIRVWDDGRGIDSRRDMLSTQADSLKSHGHRFLGTNGTAGGSSVLAIQNNASDILTYGINQPDSSTKIAIEATGGNETRPRNIAFSFIVRTA
ncbi:phage tail protein [Citrobacter sp. Cf111]|uniref:phage tail-collar fiber domain-containing protein n=1 Tax=Citrobacter sp. Cf111 TaxID=2985064 RepID=UPI00257817A3|nr:phage tail protein [Citrobacter sp. Cf111]MDM3169407.1 phage tail protein [Citrobacter sp. Cf111]